VVFSRLSQNSRQLAADLVIRSAVFYCAGAMLNPYKYLALIKRLNSSKGGPWHSKKRSAVYLEELMDELAKFDTVFAAMLMEARAKPSPKGKQPPVIPVDMFIPDIGEDASSYQKMMAIIKMVAPSRNQYN